MRNLTTPIVFLLALAAVPATPARGQELSGTITVHFTLEGDPPDQEWYYCCVSGGITLAVPSVLEIAIDPSRLGPATLNWHEPINWTPFPLDTSGLTISQTGAGSFTATVNHGEANLDVLGSAGPTDGGLFTTVEITNVTSGGAVCPQCGFAVLSNFVNTRYNVTLPAGAHVDVQQAFVTIENLTVESGGSVSGFITLIRQNLVNHGSGDFTATVAGDFFNDANPAQGEIANTTQLTLQGQLHNTGVLNVTQSFTLNTATGNHGVLHIGPSDQVFAQFIPMADFANHGTMTMSSGVMYGPGTVMNHGSFQWSGGNITGNVVHVGTAFSIVGDGSPVLSAFITNQGVIEQSGGHDLHVNLGGTIVNQQGALYDILDDSTMSAGFLSGFVVNAGTFRKSGGMGVSMIGPTFTNTGTIVVQSGHLQFTGGGTLDSGHMTIAEGSEVRLTAGLFSVIGDTTASGGGDVVISEAGAQVMVESGNVGGLTGFTGGANLLVTAGGNLGAQADATLTLNLTGSSAVMLAGGNISGEGHTINSGHFQWNGGTVSGFLTNESDTFAITGGQGILSQRSLVNKAVITQSGESDVHFNLGGTLVNQEGALYDIIDDSSLTAGFLGGQIQNAGTFRKSGGTANTSNIHVPIHSTGVISATQGTLAFFGGGTLDGGHMAFENGSQVQLAGGEFTVVGDNTATGDGDLVVTGGQVFAASGSAGRFTGFSAGADLLITAGSVGAMLDGSLTLNLTATSAVHFSGGSVGGEGDTINTGNFRWTGGSVGGNLTNASNNFVIPGGQGVIAGGTLINNAVITQSGESDVHINLAGVLRNQPGALYDIRDDSVVSVGIGGGSVHNAGTFRKSGSPDAAHVFAPFTNTGVIAADTGSLVFADDLTLDTTGTVRFNIRGTTPSIHYGLIDVFDLTAEGTLSIQFTGGFSPIPGQSFTLITYETRDGVFDSHTHNGPAGILLEVQYHADHIAVVSRAHIPGDVNLNGVVDISDLSRLATFFGVSMGATWTDGDLDGNGRVDISDLSRLAAAFGSNVPTGTSSIIVTFPGGGAGGGAAAGEAPEPLSAAGIVFLAVAVRARRRCLTT